MRSLLRFRRAGWQEKIVPIEHISVLQKETDYLLRSLPPDNMPSPLTEKIKKLGLSEYAGVLGRNLKAVFEK
jgi:hypothetical protein